VCLRLIAEIAVQSTYVELSLSTPAPFARDRHASDVHLPPMILIPMVAAASLNGRVLRQSVSCLRTATANILWPVLLC
jgi:hypothetical protein